MPILEQEPAVFPTDLFDLISPAEAAGGADDTAWRVIYTRSRREKTLMRHLWHNEVPFFCPMRTHQYRSPGGRRRTSHLPLFSGYVFVFGALDARRHALESGCVSNYLEVPDQPSLHASLVQYRRLMAMGVDLAPEPTLVPGQAVDVQAGPFRGFRGVVLRRHGETRLLIALDFLQQGASVEVNEVDVAALTP